MTQFMASFSGVEELQSSVVITIIVLICILSSLIQIAPIKINPWSSFFYMIGKYLNQDVEKHLDKVDSTLMKLQEDSKSIHNSLNEFSYALSEHKAIDCRVRILSFEDGLQHGESYTKESFDNILNDITFYEVFCKEHPDFRNNIAWLSISHIKSEYKKRLIDHNF